MRDSPADKTTEAKIIRLFPELNVSMTDDDVLHEIALSGFQGLQHIDSLLDEYFNGSGST